MTWQPIETAPKDRSLLVICPDLKGRPHVVEGMWSGVGWIVTTFSGGVIRAKPTHWMPLPSPPKSAEI